MLVIVNLSDMVGLIVTSICLSTNPPLHCIALVAVLVWLFVALARHTYVHVKHQKEYKTTASE